MARSFSSGDARKLVNEYKKQGDLLLKNRERYLKNRGKISEQIDLCLDESLMEILEQIPVDELSREKKGIRVKCLKEEGFLNYADLYRADAGSLEAVNGISEQGSYVVKEIVNRIAEQAKENAKLKLSADHKNQSSTELIRTLSAFRNEKQGLEDSVKILDQYEQKVTEALNDVKRGQNGFRWFFSSKEKKQKAEEAYQYLTGLLSGEYGTSVDKIMQETGNSVYLNGQVFSAKDLWNGFQKEPIGYFNIIEEIAPDCIGTKDTTYGLPEEIADAVGNETFSTEGLNCTLRKYQEWGVRYVLRQKKVLLGDEMGLGKTIQAIAVMVSLRNAGNTHFMVICPASVVTNWCREIRKMSDLSVIKIHGAARLPAMKEWQEKGGVAVTTYETTAHFNAEQMPEISIVVVDEAHYIKNPGAQRTKHTTALCKKADRLLFMTGTALENRVDEMVSLISVLQPEIAKEVRGMEALSSAEVFKKKIAPVYYRRRREDVLTELPELIENEEWCELMEEEERIYEDAILEQSFTKARRVSFNVDDLKDSSKACRLLEIVEDAKEDGGKVIVFSFFLDTIRKVKAMLKDQCTEPINGSVPVQRRQEIIDEFDKAEAGTVLAAQIQSGGTGLNIQSASVVIICEPQFKPSIENQAISRAYRMGQTRNVLVYRLLCEDTVDEDLTKLLKEKQKIFDHFADESVAAQENFEIDQNTFGTMMKEEAERISKKRENR